MVFGRRYRATEKIGTGGMADVYKAVDEVLGRTVAVKVLHPKYATDPSFTQRFRQEAQAAANLVMPNIVNIYDWGQDAETYYIVMEYVRGTDLKQIINERGKLSPAKVADIGAQVCSALSVAHGYDIIHRDIKPHNIMVQPDGMVKVMDFGIARAVNSNMTQTGSVLGTAHYVSPEQAQGKPLTAASDLYSLGIVLYEAATGRLPFDADTPVAVALKQVNDEPRPPRTIDPGIPPALEAVILRAMEKAPQARYASADEMRRDLLSIARGESPSAMVAGSAAAAAAALGETAVMAPVSGGGAQRPPASAKRRNTVWPWVLVAALLIAGGLGAAYAVGLIGGKVVVPNLVGMPLPGATDALTSAKLTLGSAPQEFSATVPTGTVISQDPSPGTTVEKNTAVNVVVSKGVEQVVVPDVTGLPESQAAKLLESRGFNAQSGNPVYSPTVPLFNVVKQAPVAGTSLPKGATVVYILSKGPQMVQVPDVIGKTEGTALSNLKGAGFKVHENQDYSDTYSKGHVISQHPDPGGSLAMGSTVTITISLGPNTVAVPDVVGQKEADARKAITDAGLVPSVTYQAVSPGPPPGVPGFVLSQSPASGTDVKRGSTVKIVVGQ